MNGRQSTCKLVTAGLLAAACAAGPAAPPPGGGAGATIVVLPSPLNLVVGGQGSLIALAYDSAGNLLPAVTFTWSSQGTGVATVSGAGLVTGVSPGTTTATAAAGSARGVAVINVSQGSAVSLEVVPPTASIPVGGTMSYTVIARDAAGQIRPSPAVTWTSSATSIATINSSAQALGRATGTTQIGAFAGSLVATPATLNVGSTAPCHGIASYTTFDVLIGWRWAWAGTNSENHAIATEHSAEIRTVLTQTAAVGIATWEGPPGGNAGVNDTDRNLGSQPVTTRRVRGQGAIATTVATPVAVVPLPGPMLQVDLATCMYRFEASPWIEMTLTDTDGRTETATLPVGSISTEWMPVGAFSTLLGISDASGLVTAPAHSVLWLSAGTTSLGYYVPHGFGSLAFAGVAGASEPAAGEAILTWGIKP